MSMENIWSKVKNQQGCCPVKPAGSYLFHVPKCGGTSVRKMLQGYMDAGGLTFCNHIDNAKIAGAAYYNCIATMPEKQKYLEQIYQGRFMKECSVISSHNDATLLDRLDKSSRDQFFSESKQLMDIIVVREPVARQLSEFKMKTIKIAKRDISTMEDPYYKQRYMQQLDLTGNKITKMLSGFFGCYDFSQPLKTGYADEFHLKQALINLSQFCVIIVMEDPTCGLARMSQIFNVTFPAEYKNANPGVDVTFSTDYVKQANVSNNYDQIIYQYALELNKLQCEQAGVPIQG